MSTNPYSSASQADASTARTRTRKVAISLIAAPFLLAFPLHYWAMNHAGSWFVSTGLEPDHRSGFLGLMYVGLIMSIAVWCFFVASILLWRDRFYPLVSGIAAMVFGLLAVPAGFFLAIGISAYFKFG